MLGFLIIGIMFTSIFWRRWNFSVIGFCLLFLVLGIWRYEFAQSKIIYPQEKNITFFGTVAAEPDVRANNIKLVIKPDQNGFRQVYGKVLATTDRYPEYQYGDKLKISGQLQIPEVFDEFHYRDFLAKDGIYSVIYYPEIELLERGKYTGATRVFFAGVLEFKNKLREVIFQNLSPPQSSILAAIILGDKRQISQEWKEKLNYAGLRHLTAISGMHVGILTVILMSFLIGLGFWRQRAFYFTIALIAFFIIMTGLQASAIRAGIMGGLFLLAQQLGRMNISSRAIIFAATLMLVDNPLLLKLDVGFQLSFLAMLGIIYLVPIFQNLLSKVSDFFQLKNILAITISAQIFTLPILIYNFGYFSAVAPITNILIVPFLPFIMGWGFIFVFAGTILSFFGWFFSLPVWLLLTYLIKIADWFSSFSFSAYFFEVSWVWLLISYLILGLFIWRFNEKQKLKFLKY